MKNVIICSVNVIGFSTKNKHKIVYPNMDSARRSVQHGEHLPSPIPPDDGVDADMVVQKVLLMTFPNSLQIQITHWKIKIANQSH